MTCPNCLGTGSVKVQTVMPVEDILDEAKRITSTDRNKLYGPPERNLANIAAMWTVIFGVPITARQVGIAMIAMKLCREVHAPHRDNLVDTCGYARITSLLP